MNIKLTILVCLTATFFMAQAAHTLQQQTGSTISGMIVDEAGEALTGANIQVEGASLGTVADLDGKFSLWTPSDTVSIQVSYVGYLTQTVVATGKQPLYIVLKEDSRILDEIVVVGYSAQVRKDITGSVAVVSAETLTEMPVATFAEALQGKASGVYISSTGAPGSETTVRIRGVGSINGSDPLIVVDGVSGVSIASVNPNDIESLQVLKDASATAIYGAQGANGVIIITTRQGNKAGKVQVSYSGYTGITQMANKGYDLLNAWEAMEFQAQGMVNLRNIRKSTASLSHPQFGSLDANDELQMPYAIKPAGLSEAQVIQQFGSIEAWEASYRDDGTNSWSRSAYYQIKMRKDGYSEEEARKGSNWYDLVTRTGRVQNHQLSLSGGSDKGVYSMSLAYTSREGTVIASRFDRYSLRANTTFVPNHWLTIGQNTNLAVVEYAGDRGIQSDESVFAQTYTMQPWVPVKNIGGDWAGSQATEGGRTISAVHAASNLENDWTRSFKGQSAVFAELRPDIDGLTLKTQYSATLDGAWDLAFNERTIMSNKEGTANNSLAEAAEYRLNWQWTNTATYTRKFNADHNMTLLIGSEALSQNNGRHITGERINYAFENDPDTWILDNGASSGVSNSGYIFSRSTMFGLFGRADYSFRGTYLATFTIRRDASSKFGDKNRWGTFPSASLGWRISDEDFMTPARGWLNDLKLRAGYGTTGNSNIGAYNYAYRYATGDRYLYPITGSDTEVSSGYALRYLGDADAKWETTRMLNTGIDATLLKNRLTLSADWFLKETADMLVPANWSALAGDALKPQINIGDVENIGAEIAVAWHDKLGNLRYNINANLSTYRNKVIKLGSSDLFNDTRLQKVNITTEGQPVGMFYGFKVAGIYQNEDDVTNFKNNKGERILPFAVAEANDLNPEAWIGRYKIEDVNNDGKINADDRTIIGNPHPDFTGGLNIGIAYRNLDVSAAFYFSVGNDLFMQYMYYTHFGALQSNYSRDRRDNSWHLTDNPDGIYPLWATGAGEGTEAANESNSTYVADGSYLRMQTLTAGYSLPKRWMNKINIEKIRFYAQLSNAFTWTRYPGLDPEIRSVDPDNTSLSSDRNKGVDYGSYGVPRQWIFGINISF